MNPGASSRFMQDDPHVPIWTVHDSIMTLPEHEKTVRSTMLETFSKFGVAPTLRTKP